MTVIGVDPGTSCGWCLLYENTIASGVWDLRVQQCEGEGMRWVRLRRHLSELAFDPTDTVLLAYEKVAAHKGTRAAHIYGGVVAGIQEFAERKGINYLGVPVGTWKRDMCGKGNMGAEQYWNAGNVKWGGWWASSVGKAQHDEAAARWIALWAQQQYAETREERQ